MKNRCLPGARRHLLLAWLVALSTGTGPGFARAAPASLALEDVVPGTRATAHTVLSGTTIERFELELVSVVHDITPDRDVILARTEDPLVTEVGIAQGMSGSPVYVDGDLVGALALTWPFQSETWFGITPVEQMAREARITFESASARADVRPGPALDFEAPREPPAAANGFAPIGSPLVMAGFDRRVVALAGELFEPWGFTVAEGGAAGRGQAGGAIEPGATIGVRLAGGDANMTAIGTVTWVDGDRVHAWGHPFFQMGEVEMPLVSGYIHAIIPSRALSFKLGSGAEVVGTATGDRGSGIFGRLGEGPPLTRFDLVVTRSGGSREFRFELVRNRFLVPALVGLTASNAILADGGVVGEETIRFRQRLVLDDGREATVSTLIAGDQTLSSVARLLSEASRSIVTNPFEKVELERIEAELVYEEGVRAGFLTDVTIDGDRPRPGDTIRGGYTIRDYRGGDVRRRFEIPLPENAREGRYLLLVSDASTAEEYEAERSPRSFRPRSLDEYLERLARLRQTDEVHIHLYRSSQGVLIRGRPLADLPPSVLSVMQRSSRSGVERELPAELVHEERVPVGRYIQGGHTILLEVEKERR